MLMDDELMEINFPRCREQALPVHSDRSMDYILFTDIENSSYREHIMTGLNGQTIYPDAAYACDVEQLLPRTQKEKEAKNLLIRLEGFNNFWRIK